eukprot:756805-Hanusia_phi.AAC.8
MDIDEIEQGSLLLLHQDGRHRHGWNSWYLLSLFNGFGVDSQCSQPQEPGPSLTRTMPRELHSPSLGNPSYETSAPIDTRYGGGAGTGYASGYFSGGNTPVADGISAGSYGTSLPYEGY